MIENMKLANEHIFKIWSNYKKYASRPEYLFDKYIPLFIAIMISIIMLFLMPDAQGLLSILKDFNSSALSIIAILAGFNTASLSVIAASNSKLLGKLSASERLIENGERSNLLVQTVSIFGYSILSELVILIIGSILIFIIPWLTTLCSIAEGIGISLFIIKLIITLVAIPWISVILHSLFISIRNITLLYNYILLLGKEAAEENNSGGI